MALVDWWRTVRAEARRLPEPVDLSEGAGERSTRGGDASGDAVIARTSHQRTQESP
ncbi:MAG TPA: hypothetical protein VIP05_25455 [Burkholderiaceae bacterium]